MTTAPTVELNRAELARQVASACVLRGNFTLRSGRTSTYYIDKYLFSTRPEILRGLGLLFAQRIEAIGNRILIHRPREITVLTFRTW